MQALVDAVQAPLRHPAALVRAQGAAARARPARRLRPHGVGRRRSTRSSAGARRASSCSTRTRRSRPSSPTVAQRFFDEAWIDAPVRPGKRPGAFCAYTVPSQHPYLLLNWTSRRRDVLTLAHEMGHGLHAYLAREQGVFHQTTPLTLAETASVFGETVTFGRLLDATDRSRGAARAARREPRGPDRHGVPPGRDEPLRGPRAHRSAASEGELSVEQFNEAWADTQAAMLGDTVEITEGYRTWWSYIPHFIGTPGLRLRVRVRPAARAVGVPRSTRSGATSSCRSTSSCSRAGGSTSPEELGAIVGRRPRRPGVLGRRARHRRRAARSGRGGGEGVRPPLSSSRVAPRSRPSSASASVVREELVGVELARGVGVVVDGQHPPGRVDPLGGAPTSRGSARGSRTR